MRALACWSGRLNSRCRLTDVRRFKVNPAWAGSVLAIALLALFAAVALGLVDLPSPTTLRKGVGVLPNAVQPAAGVGAVAALSSAFIPTPLLTLAVGFTFGVVPGTVIAAVGMTAGSAAQIALGAHLPKLTGRLLAIDRVDRALRVGGWRAIVGLRLAPGVPFAPSNYAMGAGSVHWTAVLLGTAIGVLPRCAVYAGLGAAAYTDPTFQPGWTVIALAVIATAGVAVLVGPAVSRRLADRRRDGHRPGP